MPRFSARVRIAVVFLGLALAAFAGVKFVSYAQKKAGPASPSLVGPFTISTSMTDQAGLGTNNADGNADPGETMAVNVNIQNTGTTDAQNVVLNDTTGTFLVPNGFNGTSRIGPVAVPDNSNDFCNLILRFTNVH